MLLHLVEKPDVPIPIKPSIAWPDDAKGRHHRQIMENILFSKGWLEELHPDRVKPVSPDYDPDKLISINIRVPPALHEILCLLTWEFRLNLSDVCRALLWQHIDPDDYVPVLIEEHVPDNVPYKKVKK